MAAGLENSLNVKLSNAVTQEQQPTEKSFGLMAQHSLVQLFIPARKGIFFLDLQLDNAQPMEHGLELCLTVQ